MRNTLTWMLLFGLGSPTETWAAKKAPVLPSRLEAVQCEEVGTLDFDGDGVRDLVCITRRGEDDPQRVTVVLSSAPAGVPPALDVPILHCPNCQGAMPNSFDLSASSGTPNSVVVHETGGSNSLWTHRYWFEQSGTRFVLESERHSTLERNTDAHVELYTSHQAGQDDSVRRASPEGHSGGGGVEFLDIYALPRRGAIKVDGKGGESAWVQAPRVNVHWNKYVIFEEHPLETDADLSYTLRALWDEDSLYLLIEVTDDAVVLAPTGENGVPYDHLELWTDSSMELWDGDFLPHMEPNPKKTTQLGLVPLRGSKQVKVMRWFPEEGEPLRVDAAYLPTKKGYTVEVRLPLKLFGVSEYDALDIDQRGLHKGFINLTLIASDTDSSEDPRQESMIATSQFRHRGAPFELGILHLMKGAPPADWKR